MDRFLYDSNAGFFLDKKVITISASGQTESHAKYLKRMGSPKLRRGAMNVH
jgi:hypothetical protein